MARAPKSPAPLSSAADQAAAWFARQRTGPWSRADAAEFASRIGLTPVLVSGGHESMLTCPDEVAKALLASALS